MPSKSKSNRSKSKNPKQPREENKPTRNWLELPSELMANILQRVGAVDRLLNAQKVCTEWHEICKDPAMWRVVYMDTFSVIGRVMCLKTCKHAVDRSQGQMADLTMQKAVDRSQGQMVDLTIHGFCSRGLLHYAVNRSSQLKRLEIAYNISADQVKGFWSEVIKKLSSLEELSLIRTSISQEDIEAMGRYCPLLKTLKLNRASSIYSPDNEDNQVALAIGKHLPELRHLQLIGNCMKNIGLEAILDGCCHLESLDLYRCLYLDLQGILGKIYSQQIKYLKLPHHSLEGRMHCIRECEPSSGL
ncbi:putative F-box/LRR-repeat protein 9 [Bidens hawaiensis]|uniref:putative F-box/LRR-repeat protein 9 n=1 Tax=Bidens hawaiensis TaxID=980011 RepID=UPI0040497EDC